MGGEEGVLLVALGQSGPSVAASLVFGSGGPGTAFRARPMLPSLSGRRCDFFSACLGIAQVEVTVARARRRTSLVKGNRALLVVSG